MRRSLAYFSLGSWVLACGTASKEPQTATSGGSASTSAQGSGGARVSSGGASNSAGGITNKSGGAPGSVGGASNPAGGAIGNSGGLSNSAGGAQNNTGGAPVVMGPTTTVCTIAEFQSAINQAQAGDTVVLCNGTYPDSSLTIPTSGITVRAETPGGVVLSGTSGGAKNKVAISGSNVVFSEFQFKDGNVGLGMLVEVTGSHDLLTQLNFSGYFAQKYIHFNLGQYNELSSTNIENKPATAEIGSIIQITTSATTPGYHTIRYCSFQNMPGPGHDYGNEPIRIGLGVEIGNVSRTTVEHNLFDNVYLADSEIVSVKSDENLIRYNTFTNNQGLDAAQAPIFGGLSFRLAHKGVAYGNFFLSGGGIRAKEGSDHAIYNNYFDTGVSEAITLQFVPANPLMNINIVHNTFVNTGAINLGGAGPTNVTFADNIFTKTAGNIFVSATGTETWIGNIYRGSLGILASVGLNSDPLLALNAEGYYGLTPGSPAIGAAVGGFPAILDIANLDDDPSILLDIQGQPRPATGKDVGADQTGAGAIANRPLKLADVGPSFLK